MASRTLSLALYNALLPVGLLGMAPGALKKMRQRGGRWADFGQRFGSFNDERRSAIAALPMDQRLWMHAVSVGEIGVAKKLITELLRQQPDLGIALTTTTPTGHQLALEIERQHPQRVVALYSPVDLPWVAERFLDTIRPRQIVLVEAEVWPNTVARAQACGIPVTLVNARLSPRSERRYRKARRIVAPIFNMLDAVCVQEPEDVDRWVSFGLERERVHHLGSIKYDPQGADPSPEQVEKLRAVLHQVGLADRPLLLAASTHDGEELEIARLYQHLRAQHPGLGLAVVPRHFERGPEVLAQLTALGLRTARRSQLQQDTPASPVDALIVDSTGELKAWQSLATIVIIGKSFLAHGGQNPAEAVMASKPVVFGPHMENFGPLVSLLLSAGGALQVQDIAALPDALSRLLSSPALRDELAAKGRAALMRHHGATTATARRLLAR